MTVLAFPSMRSQLRWCQRASAALRAYAGISGPEGFATMLTCVWLFDKILLIPTFYILCRQPTIEFPLLWLFLADLVNVYILRKYCIPAERWFPLAWRLIAAARLLGVAYCLCLPIDWLASLRSSAPLVCVTVSYGLVLVLRRQYLLRHRAMRWTGEPQLHLSRNEGGSQWASIRKVLETGAGLSRTSALVAPGLHGAKAVRGSVNHLSPRSFVRSGCGSCNF